MSITKKSSTLLVAAVAVTSFVSGAAYAQSGNSDTLAHITQPRADGKCWIATQQPVMDNGYGYWGACKTATTGSDTTSAAHRARAQANRSGQD